MPFLTNLTFIPEWTIFVQFAIATAILSITPGPDMTLFVGRSLSEGKAAGFALHGWRQHRHCHSHQHGGARSFGAYCGIACGLYGAESGGAGYLVWLAVQAICKGSAFSPEKNGGKKHDTVSELADRAWHQSSQSEDHPVQYDIPAAVRLRA